MTIMENQSEVNEFILVGLTDAPELQIPLFIIFTLIYLITLVGNVGIIALSSWESSLHTPMYFFLSNLSLVDFGYSSTVTPKVMSGLLTGDKIISYNGCASQSFFFGAFAATESFLLASMAYDRHAAVCKPLHYTTIMTSTVCAYLASGSYICGFLTSSIVVGNMFNLSFCRSNVVHHFFCDVSPLLVLSCSEIYITETVIFTIGSFSALFPFLVIFTSYLLIFITILNIHSAEGRQKAFSTCASHLTAVSIFYGTIIFMYFQPSSSHSMDSDKMVSVFYTMVIPMLNPLVYSLRNKEVKNALRKAIKGQGLYSLGLVSITGLCLIPYVTSYIKELS
ncbi:olfactory receptor 5B12 [Monodelphis domestica]|uniref:olfactory receptor 5B12 n=1 Tax=Monodelphis domestica TaxID=13616 RepID=UPI00020F6E70|nr:olfactory receptor 5B12 [Monodelphis domestica]